MLPADIIRRKRDGLSLSSEEILVFVNGAADESWPDYQLSALLMAIFLRGMTPGETAELTRAMADSGERLQWDDLPGPAIDKHSTGGVGDKVSLILAPLAAACGVYVPMMSGRGLGHSGGTLDKLESIPGFRVGLNIDEFRRIVKKVGFAMIGQTRTIAPADRKLYALRDVTSTVESIPLITGSILSKKFAEGISGLVMDVKFGLGAFMKTLPQARELAQSIVSVGKANGVRTVAFLTAMNAPLGEMVGNSLEMIESIQILKGSGSRDLTDLSVVLTAEMLRMSDPTLSEAQASKKVCEFLANGSALEKFRQMVIEQGGDPRCVDDPSVLQPSVLQFVIRAKSTGYITQLHAEKIGLAAMRLGAGRTKADDKIDHAVGLRIVAHLGQQVRPNDPIFEVHFRDPDKLENARPLLENAIAISDAPPSPEPLIPESSSQYGG